MKRFFVMSMALVLASGCVIIRPRRPVKLSQREALSIGLSECYQRGYECHLKEMHQTGNDIWKVKFSARQGLARGHLHLDLDAWSGNVVKVNDKMKGRSRGHDDDDDDDDRGRGKGKKGKGKDKDD